MCSTIANIKRQNEDAVIPEGDFLSGEENFFNEAAISRFPPYSETQRHHLIKARTPARNVFSHP